MPKLSGLNTVLVIGSGPIIIGQAAEFDYSGTQACKALKEEGIRVVLVNSNLATIMTDETFADAIYFEPMDAASLTSIIEKEKPDGMLATVGGQTGLNLALELHQNEILQKHGIRLLGTGIDSIQQAEDREKFRSLMQELNEPVPDSEIVHSAEEALNFAERTGYPIIVRPAYTLGGFGGGIAHSQNEFAELVNQGLSASPIGQCLVEKSIAGYREIEYEVMRDASGCCITVCNMENLDPVGVHTGDSVVVAPSQTLNDQIYHMLRSASLKIIDALNIVGGCNIQFALHPVKAEYYLIEVNPRVSRSSALASKATGYPIAKITAKLAVGYQLHELKNPVTGTTYASFEPALDYVTVKIPRWPFDKFPAANRKLGTQMKATGEVMAIERNMEAAIQKAIRSLELKLTGFYLPELAELASSQLFQMAEKPDDRRLFVLFELLNRGFKIEDLHEKTGISYYFLSVIHRLVQLDQELQHQKGLALDEEVIRKMKIFGFSDAYIAQAYEINESDFRKWRNQMEIVPSYKMVDTCAAEFEAQTAYFYSTWSGNSDKQPSLRQKIAIIGSGPIRIGQGIEFDYCCVHSVLAAQDLGYETILINNNPETVSTDFEVADTLYFEPLAVEDVVNILEFEGIQQIILQFGGQTSISLAKSLEEEGFKILGSSADLVDEMEDRDRFYSFLEKNGISKIPGLMANQADELWQNGEKLGYPLLLRPSYVIGGSGMTLIRSKQEMKAYMNEANMQFPILVDRFLAGKEAEVDVLTDGEEVFIPAIFEHIEGTGVHSGDSFAVTPPITLTEVEKREIYRLTAEIAVNMDYKGLFNIQFVISENGIFVLEINPRASRTVPIISKVTGVNLVQKAAALLLGTSFSGLQLEKEYNGQPYFTVKAPVFSNLKLPGFSPVLSPVMKSTGEVIGTDVSFSQALLKAAKAASHQLTDIWSTKGSVFVEDKDMDMTEIIELLQKAGFEVVSSKTSSFEEWLKQENKQVYVSFSPSDDKNQAVQASLHRLHVWTRKETVYAFIGEEMNQKIRKEVEFPWVLCKN